MSFPQHFCNFYLAKSKKKGSVVRTSGKLDLSLADGILDLKPVEKNMETCVNKFTDEMKHRLTLKLTDGMDFFSIYSKQLLKINIRILTLPVLCISESCIEIKIKLNFYFHTSLWCLKKFYEGTTKKYENKNIT